MDSRERRSVPGFRSQIGAERAGPDLERGQADSADCDAVASFQFSRHVFGGNGDAAIFAVLFDACDPPYFFHDASKHEDLDEEPNIINPQEDWVRVLTLR